MILKAQGALLGQIAGDSLGSLVEFKSPAEIKRIYPNGVRELADGGTFNTLAGQPTDDSEMALLLARSLVAKNTYDSADVMRNYKYWLESKPFDCGITISGALLGQMNPDSQANGALMRVSPIGIFGANYSLDQVAEWAEADAALTHPNPVCLQVNALYAMAISTAIREDINPQDLYERMLAWAEERKVEQTIIDVMKKAATEPPANFMKQMGWVLIAFQNALYQLLNAPSLEEGIVDTVSQGGDTDTNAAIAGALLGAVFGREAIPEQWQKAVLNCKPQEGRVGVYRPRPSCFWPMDVLELAEKIVRSGYGNNQKI
jgi:ADP-ribosylglycohydrolase